MEKRKVRERQAAPFISETSTASLEQERAAARDREERRRLQEEVARLTDELGAALAVGVGAVEGEDQPVPGEEVEEGGEGLYVVVHEDEGDRYGGGAGGAQEKVHGGLCGVGRDPE